MHDAASAQPLRIGLIGCGRVTTTRHLPALARVAGVEVVALADVERESVDHAGERAGVTARHTDPRALLDDPHVEAVGVCVPPASHTEIALQALQAGKHVVVEKPIALKIDDASRLIETAADSELRVMMGFNLRWHRLIRRARKVVEEGRLGQLRSARSVFTTTYRTSSTSPPWKRHVDLGGTAVLELGTHHFDLWRVLLRSEVEEVSAVTSETGDSAGVTARMASGVVVESLFSEVSAPAHEFELYGDAALLRISLHRFDGLEVREASAHAGAPSARLRGAAGLVRSIPAALAMSRAGGDLIGSFAAEWRHFASAVRSGGQVEATPEDGGKALEIALAARESGASGRSISIRERERSTAVRRSV